MSSNQFVKIDIDTSQADGNRAMFLYLQNFDEEKRIRDSNRGIMLSLEGYWIKQFDGGMATTRNRDVKKPIIG